MNCGQMSCLHGLINKKQLQIPMEKANKQTMQKKFQGKCKHVWWQDQQSCVQFDQRIEVLNSNWIDRIVRSRQSGHNMS